MTAIARYLPLFKLRICWLITLSALVGLAAAPEAFSLEKAAFLALATMAAAAAAIALNHYFDMDIDRVMKRTRARPLEEGCTPAAALVSAGALLALSKISDFKGKPLVLSFVYTSCTHTCGTLTASLKEAFATTPMCPWSSGLTEGYLKGFTQAGLKAASWQRPSRIHATRSTKVTGRGQTDFWGFLHTSAIPMTRRPALTSSILYF